MMARQSNPRRLTMADVERLGPAAKAQVLAQLGRTEARQRAPQRPVARPTARPVVRPVVRLGTRQAQRRRRGWPLWTMVMMTAMTGWLFMVVR